MTRYFALPIACCVAMLCVAYVASPVFAQETLAPMAKADAKSAASATVAPVVKAKKVVPPPVIEDLPAPDFDEPDGFRVDLCMEQSFFAMSLFSGDYHSALTGSIELRFDGSFDVKGQTNADVPVVLSHADLFCVTPIRYGPQAKVSQIVINPKRASVGLYNTETGEIWIDAYFITPRAFLPVPMPILLTGTFEDGYLNLSAAEGAIDAGADMRIQGAIAMVDWPSAGGESAIPEPDRPVCLPMIELDGD